MITLQGAGIWETPVNKKLAAALAALLALVVADAAATGLPVPPECEASDLSAEEQARCDFIARTPHICRRQGLSEDTQFWCDQVRSAGEPQGDAGRQLDSLCEGADLGSGIQELCQRAVDRLRSDPLGEGNPICERDRLSNVTSAQCEAFAGVPHPLPAICFKLRLDSERQRLCDVLRFIDEPVYQVVRLARDGSTRSMKLVETATGRARLTWYPYGLMYGAPRDNDREARMLPEQLESFIKGRPAPRPPRLSGSPPSEVARNLNLGWNSSTGPTNGACYNLVPTALLMPNPENGPAQASNFTITSNRASQSAQINLSASVSASLSFFSADATASFSETWKSSSQSTAASFNTYSLRVLNTILLDDEPLNAFGQRQVDNFSATCGSEYLATTLIGFLATLTVDFGSATAAATSKISSALSVSGSLGNLESALDSLSSSERSNSYFTLSLKIFGDSAGDNSVAPAFNAALASSSFTECQTSLSPAACGQLFQDLNAAATDASAAINNDFATLRTQIFDQDNPDFSNFVVFADGIQGLQDQTTAVHFGAESDVYAPIDDQLHDAITLVDELNTLNARAVELTNLVNQNTSLYNYTPVYNVLEDLTTLGSGDRRSGYGADAETIIGDLRTCLSSNTTPDNLDTQCATVINLGAINAFEYYDEAPAGVSESVRDLLQQNTIALQFTSTSQVASSQPNPRDVIYSNRLSTVSNNTSDAGLGSFYTRFRNTNQNTSIYFLPLGDGSPAIASSNVVPSSSDFQLLEIERIPSVNDRRAETHKRTGKGLAPFEASITRPGTLSYSFDNGAGDMVTFDFIGIDSFFGP